MSAVTAATLRLRGARAVQLAALVLMTASIIQLAMQAAIIHDIPLWRTLGVPILTVLLDTSWGHYWLWRVGALALVLGLVSIDGRKLTAEASYGDNRRFISWLALAAGCALLLPFSLTSHTAAVPGLLLEGVTTDFLHFLAAAVWVGGLFHFALAFPVLASRSAAQDRARPLDQMLPRFSTLALLSVGVLAITGVYSAWAQVGNFDGLATPYGAALTAKLALLMPMLGLGALNFWWVRRRLSRGDAAAWRWLRRFVVTEALVALLVVGALAWMTSLEPGRSAAARAAAMEPPSLSITEVAEGAEVTLRLEPGATGRNRMLVELRDTQGNPLIDASRVELRVFYLDGQIIEHTQLAIVQGSGRYFVDNMLLNLSGNWEAAITVQRRQGFDIRAAVQFRLPAAPPPTNPVSLEPDPRMGRQLWLGQVIVMGALLTTVALLARDRRRGKWRRFLFTPTLKPRP